MIIDFVIVGNYSYPVFNVLTVSVEKDYIFPLLSLHPEYPPDGV